MKPNLFKYSMFVVNFEVRVSFRIRAKQGLVKNKLNFLTFNQIIHAYVVSKRNEMTNLYF